MTAGTRDAMCAATRTEKQSPTKRKKYRIGKKHNDNNNNTEGNKGKPTSSTTGDSTRVCLSPPSFASSNDVSRSRSRSLPLTLPIPAPPTPDPPLPPACTWSETRPASPTREVSPFPEICLSRSESSVESILESRSRCCSGCFYSHHDKTKQDITENRNRKQKQKTRQEDEDRRQRTMDKKAGPTSATCSLTL